VDLIPPAREGGISSQPARGVDIVPPARGMDLVPARPGVDLVPPAALSHVESKPVRRRRSSPSSGSVQITERDRILLSFAAEHRFVTAAQIAVVLEATAAAADARLQALSRGGYLRREQKLHRAPAAHRITPAGLRAIGSDLPAPRRLDLATYRHDEGLAWLMLAAHRGRFGALREVTSERRMRSEDARATPDVTRHAVRLGGTGPGGRDRLHYPDMVVRTASGHRVAFELELTTKSTDRRERILAGYGADPGVDVVVYLVDAPEVRRAIQRSAARVGVSHLIRVHDVRLRGSEPAAVGSLAAVRSHRRALDHGGGAGVSENAR
jgi:hypothetical protein